MNCHIPQHIESGLGKKEYHKEYHKKNAERKKEYHKEWYAKNAETCAKKMKEWYAKNAEKLGEKVKCGCGSEIRKSDLSQHKRSQKHQKWENLPEPNLIFVD